MNDAVGVVDIAPFAQRKARVTRLFRDFQAFFDARFRIEHDDFCPRTHHVAHDPASQIERVHQDFTA